MKCFVRKAVELPLLSSGIHATHDRQSQLQIQLRLRLKHLIIIRVKSTAALLGILLSLGSLSPYGLWQVTGAELNHGSDSVALLLMNFLVSKGPMQLGALLDAFEDSHKHLN